MPWSYALRLLLGDIDNPVNPAGIENLWQILLWPTADTRNAGAFLGLHTNDLDIRVLLLQIDGSPHDCAGGAHRTDKVGNISIGIPPNLRACPFLVREWIIRDLQIGPG